MNGDVYCSWPFISPLSRMLSPRRTVVDFRYINSSRLNFLRSSGTSFLDEDPPGKGVAVVATF